ncbi:MAG TPA: transcriptional repressor [Acidimicrobiales bacterium]|nr:transcriptional repressor [Acidimicrobiales bacterium]
MTGPRASVYRALAAMGGHRSADEVHEALSRAGEAHARASVYNALRALAGGGLVMVADAGPGATLYEAGTKWHHHAVCRQCGVVTDVPCVVGAKPCLTPEGEWGEVDEAQVIFRGICSACAARRLSASQQPDDPTASTHAARALFRGS